MSRVYFHSPSSESELLGSERAWLGHLASGPAQAAWDLDQSGAFDRAREIVAMVPEEPDGEFGANYLHTYMRQAEAQTTVNKVAYSNWKPGQAMGYTDQEPIQRFISALKLKLRVEGVKINVAGATLHSMNVELNTALVAGSDPIRLAAKIHGWCESHCWVDGPDRAWLAGIIDQGLSAGFYRPSAGWESVQADLRSRDDEPVVMSYSVCDSFPNDALTSGQREGDDDAWYDLPSEDQWRIAFDALKVARPWAQLTPESLAEVTFSDPVTVYDLFASDRDGRIRTACGIEAQPAERSSSTS